MVALVVVAEVGASEMAEGARRSLEGTPQPAINPFVQMAGEVVPFPVPVMDPGERELVRQMNELYLLTMGSKPPSGGPVIRINPFLGVGRNR